MEDDGYFDELFRLFRQSQTVSAPNGTLGPYKRFEKDYQKACELKKAPFSNYLAEKQWDQMDKESRAEYENLSKRDSNLYEKLLSMYNQITNLSKKKPDGYIVFLQEKGKDSSINISELWTSLQEDEKKQYEEKAQQNQKENIESLIDEYISEYKQYIDKLKEVPLQLEFIHKKEEENNELDQIDIIIGIKRINGKKEYLVRFKGKTGKDAKWFPKKKLRNVKEMVKEFEEAYFKESFKNDEPSSGFDSTPVQLHQGDHKVEKAEENQEVIEEDEDQDKFQQLEDEFEEDNKKKRNTSQNKKSKKTEKKIVDKQKKTIKPPVKIMKEEKIQRGKEQPRTLRERNSKNDEQVKVEKKQSQSIDKLDTTQKRIKVQTSTSQEPKSKVSQREQKASEKTSQKVSQKPTQNATLKVESQSKLRSSKSHTIQQTIPLAVEEKQPKKDSPKQQPQTKSKSQQKTKSQPPAQSSRQRQLRSKSASVPEIITKSVTKAPIGSQSKKPEPEQRQKQIVSGKKVAQGSNQKKSETSKKVQTRQVNKKVLNGNKNKAINNQKAKNNQQKNENVKKTIQKKTINLKAKAPERKSRREQVKKTTPLPIKKKIVKSMNLRKRK